MRSQNSFEEKGVKLITLGDFGVGKSSLILKFVEDRIPMNEIVSKGRKYQEIQFSGYDILVKRVRVNNESFAIKLWDTGGYEETNTIDKSYFLNTNGVLFVFDITNKNSFKNLTKWYEQAKNELGDNFSMILIGNKCDLDKERCVKKSDAEILAKKMGCSYLETSVFEGTNLEEAFMMLVPRLRNGITEPPSRTVTMGSLIDTSFKPGLGQMIMLGESSVGKTSLAWKYCNEKCNILDSIVTLGVEFQSKDMIINNGNFRLKIWDTGGQEKFRSLSKNFVRRVEGVAFVFDLSQRETFERIREWASDMKDLLKEGCQIILIGNKSDLNHEIKKEEIEKLTTELNSSYFETSALKGTKVNEPFDYIANQIYNALILNYQKASKEPYRKVLRVTNNSLPHKDASCPC